MEDRESKPKRRPRVSLLSLFLLVAIASLAMTLWIERQSTSTYRQRIADLEREVGEVVVTDQTKLTVQPIGGTVDPWRHFRWRAYVPAGRFGEVVLTIASDKTPLKRRRAMLRLESGETNFDVSAFQHPSGRSWMYGLRQPFHHGGGLSAPAPTWFGSESAPYDAEGAPIEVAEAKTAQLFHHSGTLESGEQVTVVVTVRHCATCEQPSSSARASTEKIAPRKTNQTTK